MHPAGQTTLALAALLLLLPGDCHCCGGLLRGCQPLLQWLPLLLLLAPSHLQQHLSLLLPAVLLTVLLLLVAVVLLLGAPLHYLH